MRLPGRRRDPGAAPQGLLTSPADPPRRGRRRARFPMTLMSNRLVDRLAANEIIGD